MPPEGYKPPDYYTHENVERVQKILIILLILYLKKINSHKRSKAK